MDDIDVCLDVVEPVLTVDQYLQVAFAHSTFGGLKGCGQVRKLYFMKIC